MPAKLAQAALVVALVFFGYLFTLNPSQVSFTVYPGATVRASLALLLLMTFVVGFGVAFLTGTFREAFLALRSWRHERSDGRREEARRLFRTGRGEIFFGRHRAARRLLQKAQRKAPEEPSIALEVARAELGEGRFEAAERRVKALLEDDPQNPELLSLLVDVCEARGDVNGKTAALGRWIEADPSYLPSLAALRDLYRSKQAWNEAARVQEKLLVRTEGRQARRGERRTLSELLLLANGRQPPVKAAAALRRLVEEDEEFAAGYAALGDALQASGDEEGATRAWLKGYKATNAHGLLLRIEALKLRRGEGEELLKLYRKLARKDAGAALLRARLFVVLNRAEEALEALGKPVPQTSEAQWLAGEALFRLRSFDEAARSFRRSVGTEDRPPPLTFTCNKCGRAQREWVFQCPVCGAFDALKLDVSRRPASTASA